jgi:serine/threonine protein kinase
MSPEQARGEPVDARSDLFSLGSVIYAMCTGRPPFRAESSFGVLRRITDTQPHPIRELNSDIPEWLAAIVKRLHDQSPGNRLGSAAELAALLEGCLAHVQQPTAVPLPAACRIIPSPPRHPLLASLSKLAGFGEAEAKDPRRSWLLRGVAVGLVLLGGAVVATFAFKSDHREPSGRPVESSASQSTELTTNDTGKIELDTEWDDAQREIDTLLRAGHEAIPLVERIWIRQPESNRDINKQDPIQILDRE